MDTAKTGDTLRPRVVSGVREIEEEIIDDTGDGHSNGNEDVDGPSMLVAVPIDENGEPIVGHSPHIVGLLPPGNDGSAIVRRMSSGTLRFRPEGGSSGGGTAVGTLMRRVSQSRPADVAEEEFSIAAGLPHIGEEDADDDDSDDDEEVGEDGMPPGDAIVSADDKRELEQRVAEELKMRMEVYERLTVLSALLVGAALFIFVQVGLGLTLHKQDGCWRRMVPTHSLSV